jgi:hypothetical protein
MRSRVHALVPRGCRRFVAPLVAEQRIRRLIETTIVRLLLAAGKEAAFLDEGLSTWNRRPDEAVVRVVSRSKNILRGVPREFEA